MPDESTAGASPGTGTARPVAPRDLVVSCPQCGGENPVPSGERVLACAFCDASLFVDRAGAVGHYFLPRLLDGDKARSALKRWMAGNDTVKNLDEKARIESVAAVTFPMWLFRVGAKGGEEVFVEPAAPTPIPQLADLKVPAGKLEPYREPEPGAEAAGATIPLATARGWLEQRGVTKITEMALVEIPLYRVRYDFQGASYQALVEASTGQVLASVFPEKAESPYVLVALVGLVLFGAVGFLVSNPLLKLLAFGVTAVPLVLLAWWVTRKV